MPLLTLPKAIEQKVIIKYSAFKKIQSVLVYLAFITGIWGNYLFTIDVGPFNLFPYRIILLVLWVIGIVQVIMVGRLSVPHRKVFPFLIFLGIWLLWAFASLLWAASKTDGIRGVIFLFTGSTIILFTLLYLQTSEKLDHLYVLLICVYVALIPVGFWETLTGTHLPISRLYNTLRIHQRYAPTTFFVNPNDYAAYIILSWPLLFTRIQYSKRWPFRIIGSMALISSWYLLFKTSSRAGYIAFLFQIIFWFLVIVRPRTQIRFTIIVLIITCLLLLTFPSKTTQIEHILQTQLIEFNFEDFISTNASNMTRFNLLRNAFIFFCDSLGFGVGAGNVDFYMEREGIFPTGQVYNTHNWWMELLANYGLLIFLGYLIFYITLLGRIALKYRHTITGMDKALNTALQIALVGFLIVSVSPSSVMAFRPQWMLISFSLAYLNYKYQHIPGSANMVPRPITDSTEKG